ncbi:hypothetical protein RclHR1_04150004 [Rhizophagus clarus]|uniref:Uncharacterized protein n=1 Tax=Rhizophagus clarus TaxID=94130 RepID=A0A2Z6RWI1_9GLOM|nr:hypothetical protein RclHR1_04150004 [Rhizophagus clarus]
MEQPSVTNSATQSVDYLGQTHKWTDTDVISSYKEVYKQLDICQEKLHEEREQKGQRKLRKSSSHYKQLSQKAAQRSQQSQRERNVDVAIIGNIENVSKRRKQQKEESALRPLIGCVDKGNKPVSSKTLKCPFPYQREDIYFERKKDCPTNTDSLKNVDSSYIPVPRYSRYIQNRRIQRRIRRENAIDSYSFNNIFILFTSK